MCGIAGVILEAGKNRTPEEFESIKEHFSSLLCATQVRGTDASGVFILGKDQRTYFKAPVKAEDLTKMGSYWALMDRLNEDTTAIVAHCRLATHGSPAVNTNNHPVISGPILGVHNGVIYNHDDLKADAAQGVDEFNDTPEVDSAAIMMLLRDSSRKEHLKLRHIVDAAELIRGPMAIAVADVRKTGYLYLARSGNPLVMAHDGRGLSWFASTSAILDKGLAKAVAVANKRWYVPDDTVARFGRELIDPSAPMWRDMPATVGYYAMSNGSYKKNGETDVTTAATTVPSTVHTGYDTANWYRNGIGKQSASSTPPRPPVKPTPKAAESTTVVKSDDLLKLYKAAERLRAEQTGKPLTWAEAVKAAVKEFGVQADTKPNNVTKKKKKKKKKKAILETVMGGVKAVKALTSKSKGSKAKEGKAQ